MIQPKQKLSCDSAILYYPFKKLDILGQGTYGCVYKCINMETQEIVAIKQVNQSKGEEQEGIHSTTLREMSVLQKLKGFPGIVLLKDVLLTQNYKQYLVFEYIEEDVKKYMERYNYQLRPQKIQFILYQIISAVYVCHSHRIFHRDLKPANILIDINDKVKLADFGLAKHFGHPLHRTHTKEVQTLWYRAPELLLGNQSYTSQVDMFSIGCILGEILFGRIMFKGVSEIDQLFKIFEYMGTPNSSEQNIKSVSRHNRCHTEDTTQDLQNQLPKWEGLNQLPHYSQLKFPRFSGKRYNISFEQEDSDYIDLMHGLLELDPKKRFTAKDALTHKYFDSINPDERLKFGNLTIQQTHI